MAIAEPQTIVTPPPALLKRVSWGAIFAGALAAIALSALLGLMGIGMGLAAIDPMDPTPFSGIGTGTIIWWAITNILALGVGGFVAARLAGIPRSFTGMLHGLTVWSITLLISLWLATSAIGVVIGAASSVVQTTARTTASVVGTVAGAAVNVGGAALPDNPELAAALSEQGLTRDAIRREAQQILDAAGIGRSEAREAQQAVEKTARDIVRTPGDAGQDINQLIDRLFGGPDAVISDAERQRLVSEIAQRAGVTPQEAERIAGRWETQARAATDRVASLGGDVRQGVGQAAEQGLDALSAAAWGAFIASLIGLAAALVGSALGAPRIHPPPVEPI